MNKTLLESGMIVATVMGIGMISQPAHALSFTLEGPNNFGSDPIKVEGVIEDIGNNLKFTINIVPETFFGTGNIGDMQGIFFDVDTAFESLLNTFSIVNANQPISNVTFSANNVINFGGGNNLEGNGTLPFDAGFTVGTPGLGRDDIQSIMFELTSSSGPLDIGLFTGNPVPRFGVRATSVGPVGTNRSGSAKIVGEVPTPALLPGLIGLGVAALRKKQGEEQGEKA